MSSASRQPPAVQYPVRRSRSLGLLLSAVLLLGTGVLAGWLFFGAGSAPRWFVWGAGGLWLFAACCALNFWRSQFVGVLRWGGQAWELETPGAMAVSTPLATAPEVIVDFQSHLWLHAVAIGRGHTWLWLERLGAPEHWLDFRRAVYFRARPGIDNNDATVPATHHGRES